MSFDAYESALASSGKLKLKALARLADGRSDAVFEGCVLFHEAARVELRAVRLVDAPPATRLAALVEACCCYIDGRDPLAAAETYSSIHQELDRVDEGTRDALMSRLAPRYEGLRAEFVRDLEKLKVIRGALPGGRLVVPRLASDLKKAEAELASMTASYPGVAGLWWLKYRLAESRGRAEDAWRGLQRARELDPDNTRFTAISVLTSTWALPRLDAEQYVANARPASGVPSPEVCLMYALAELRLARTESPRNKQERWRAAQEVVHMGLAAEPTPAVRNNLRATELLVGDYLAGRTPSVRLLYRAGLHDVAVQAKGNVDVETLLGDSATKAA